MKNNEKEIIIGIRRIFYFFNKNLKYSYKNNKYYLELIIGIKSNQKILL